MAALTGEEKAGLLLLNLDPRVADAVLTRIAPLAKTRLRNLMKRMESSPQREGFLAQVLEEAEGLLAKPELRLFGSADKETPGKTAVNRAPALDRLVGGEEKTAASRVEQTPTPGPAIRLAQPEVQDAPAVGADSSNPDVLAALNRVATDRLIRALAGESPRAIALVLNFLKGEKAGTVFQQLNSTLRREVSVCMATSAMPGPEIVRRTVAAVLAKEQALLDISGHPQGEERFKKMAELLWKLDRAERNDALAALQERDPLVANQVRELLYQFSDILRLDQRSVQKVLGQIDGKVVATALIGANEEIKQKIMDNLSKRARDGLVEEMEFLGVVPANQIQQAQKSLVAVIQQLDQSGEITMIS